MMRSTLSAAVTCAAVAGLLIATPAFGGTGQVRAEGELVRYSAAVGDGATARVHAVYTSAGQTVVTLHVQGLQPDTEYGAHAHAAGCGTAPADPKGHFQLVPGSVPTDPAYANPQNEIWLDLTTDASGEGAAQARVPWVFPTDRRAESVVIHVEHTHTGPDDSGTAGARLACLDVDF